MSPSSICRHSLKHRCRIVTTAGRLLKTTLSSSAQLPPCWVYFIARTSAASTCGCLVRALQHCLRMTASENPASVNSRRKATPSFAPAIHANQFDSLARASGDNGLESISSAANIVPPGLTTRASSRKIASLAGFRLKIPLTMATSISSSAMGNCSAPASRNSTLLAPASATA